MKRSIAGLMTILFLGAAGFLSAQSNPTNYAVILFAQGDDLSIQRGESFRDLNVKKDTVIGLPLIQGDLVQTGQGTSLEIQLLPSKTYIKVAENTSFRLTGIQRDTGTLEVLYGRVRAKVSTVTAGADSFRIQSKSAVAGVRGTDFGYDMILIPGNSQAPKTSVYCFEGAVAVQSAAPDVKSPVIIKADQIVVIVPSKSQEAQNLANDKAEKTVQGDYSLFVSPAIPDPIRTFWKANDFKGQKVDEVALKEQYPVILTQVKQETDRVNGKAEGKPLQDITVVTANKEKSLADQIPPIVDIASLQTLSKEQYVYGPDTRKQVGMILGGTGLALSVITGFGASFGQFDSTTTSALGFTGGITSAALIGTGVVLYLLGYLAP